MNATRPVTGADRSDVETPFWLGFSKTAWLRFGLLALALAVLYRTNLIRLWLKTNPISGDANWGHSLLVPLIGLYYLYIHREELKKAPVRPSLLGLPILIAGPLFFLLAISHPVWSNDYFKDLSIVITLFGLVLFTCGWYVMKTAWFPILFLVCAFPWPGLFYSRVATPLQHLAAQVAVEAMKITGVEAEQQGTKILIRIPPRPPAPPEVRALNVAEACAGMRSLMTFITLGAAMAFLSARPMWQKVVLILSAIPIAIFCNVIRVSGQGLLDYYWTKEWSQGFSHGFAGIVMLVPAIFLLLLVGKILDMAVVEVSESGKRGNGKARRQQPAVLKRRRPAGNASTNPEGAE